MLYNILMNIYMVNHMSYIHNGISKKQAFFFAGLCCPHCEGRTKSQVRSASVKDAATITDSRSATVKD